jgi:hypothetical protein
MLTALRSSDLDITQIIRGTLARIEQKQAKIEQNQTIIMKKMEAMDTATATRLSDFREHVDKKFERVLGSSDCAFDEIWDKLGSNNLEVKRVRDIVSGQDPRRTPPADDGIHDNGAKRRRFEE